MAYALVNTLSFAPGQTGGTSANVDMSGADLFVVVVSQGTASHTMSDSLSNANWTYLANNAQNGNLQFSYCWNASSSSSITFTISVGAGGYPAVIVYGFSGSHTAADPKIGYVNTASNGVGTTCQPGALTPVSASPELFVTGVSNFTGTDSFTINSSFATPTTVAFSGGNNYEGSASWKVSATLENPTWTASVGFQAGAVSMATFKEGATAAATTKTLAALGVG